MSLKKNKIGDFLLTKETLAYSSLPIFDLFLFFVVVVVVVVVL